MTSYEHIWSFTYRLLVANKDREKLSAPGLWSPDISIEPYRKKRRRRTNPLNKNVKLPKNKDENMANNDTLSSFENFSIHIDNDRNVWLRKPNKSL